MNKYYSKYSNIIYIYRIYNNFRVGLTIYVK